MLHTAVILNGPPGVGKDTLANMLEGFGFAHNQFKDQLYADTAEHFEVDFYDFVAAASDRERKEQPYGELGMTPREMLIHVSERVMKPHFGSDYFGKAAAMHCLMNNFVLAVFSDGGFGDEVECLAEHYIHVVIIRLHREGFSFGNDSRNYIEGRSDTFDVTVKEGDPEDTLDHIVDILDPYIHELAETFSQISAA